MSAPTHPPISRMDRWEELSFLLREQSSVQCPTRIRECRHRSIRRYVRLSVSLKRVTQLNSARVIVALNEDNNSDSHGGGPVERCNHCELREDGSSSRRYNRHALALSLAPPPSLGWVVDGCVQVSSKAHGRTRLRDRLLSPLRNLGGQSYRNIFSQPSAGCG